FFGERRRERPSYFSPPPPHTVPSMFFRISPPRCVRRLHWLRRSCDNLRHRESCDNPATSCDNCDQPPSTFGLQSHCNHPADLVCTDCLAACTAFMLLLCLHSPLAR